jgi:hypothetical protein
MVLQIILDAWALHDVGLSHILSEGLKDSLPVYGPKGGLAFSIPQEVYLRLLSS